MVDISIPSGTGGLLKFKEEYASKINLKPIHVIAFIILIVVFRIILEFVFK